MILKHKIYEQSNKTKHNNFLYYEVNRVEGKLRWVSSIPFSSLNIYKT